MQIITSVPPELLAAAIIIPEYLILCDNCKQEIELKRSDI